MNALVTHTPTPEQAAILDAARTTPDNLIIHALAGAAKTSTLVLIAKALPGVPTLSLAFNVRIKDEMKDRLPGNCECLTLNGVGHRAWGSSIGRRLVVDKDKVYNITREIITRLPDADRAAAFGVMTDVMRAVEYGKTHGYVPTGKWSDVARPLLDDDELFASLDEEPTPLMERMIRAISFESISQALQGKIDYNDQILMPTVFHASFTQYPLVLVDETQDLSELNHAMLKKICKKRVIAVGDENQSIYAFRGAHENSMTLMAATFSMRRLDLSVSFRCPQSVVLEARSRAPAMLWPEWAEEGEVKTLPEWTTETLPPNCTILCRNNAPLFGAAIRLLKNGRYPQLVGNDIGKKLIKIMEKLGPGDTPSEAAHALIDEWLRAKEAKSRDKGAVNDQAECMRVFVEAGKTLGEAVAYAQHLMSVSGNVKLTTIHKAKGLEWDTVFILDRDLIRLAHTQERNLLYVAQTRSKRQLFYITSGGFKGT